MTASTIILQGRFERKEFKEPFRQCCKLLEELGVSYRMNPEVKDDPADFAIFFQSYPHEFSRLELGQRRRQNPFAPFFFVLGVCCEGMLRTAGPLDSPFYCYAHGWTSNEPEQIRRFLTEQPSVFDLPPTAENDEIALWYSKAAADWADGRRQTADGGRGSENGSSLKKCLILANFGPFGNDSAMNSLIAEKQRQLGYEPVCLPPSAVCRLPSPLPPAACILADADNSPREKILETIQRLRSQFADTDFTVYVDSPRIDEKNDYTRAGATHVLAKIR